MTVRPLIVTPLAIARYVECIGGTEDQAAAVLSGRAIQQAADFGARVVRMNGARILMRFAEGSAVVLNVLPFDRDRFPHQLMPRSWGGPPLSRDDRAASLSSLETAHG